MAFYAIRKSKGQQFSSEAEARLALKGLDFVDDYATLAIWALEDGPRKPNISDINPNLRGGLILKREFDISSVEDTKLNVDVAKLAHETSKRESLEKAELMRKFDKLFNDYNAVQQRCLELQRRVQLLEQGQIRVSSFALIGTLVPSTFKSSSVIHEEEAIQPDINVDIPNISLVPYDDDEPRATRSTNPTQSLLLEKIIELENKLKESEDQSA